MYLPDEIPGAQVLITVKTYPLPSSKYEELVCTAGFLHDGTWIRLYPIPFRAMPYKDQYQKYHWITLDVVKNRKDFRPESYRPKHGIEGIQLGTRLETQDNWAKRKEYALKEVFTSMGELLRRAKSDEKKSLATLKPREIIDFIIEPTEREWKSEWQDQLLQYNLFDLDAKGEGKIRAVIPKLPYKYFYKFLTDGDHTPRRLMIEDWEVGAVYWRNYYQNGHNEKEANRMVRKRFLDELAYKNDLYFFVGTTLEYHRRRALNPFVIIGVFYPMKPKEQEHPLQKQKSIHINTTDFHQPKLFGDE